MIVARLSPKEWHQYSEDAHLICFNEIRPAKMNRIDFAMTTFEDGVPQTYMTCREVDEETLYMQYGGAFPSVQGTVKSFRGYEMMLCELSHHYKRATTLIENKNRAMLKFAMKVGFEIIGVRTFDGKIYLEHLLTFGGSRV